MIKTLSSLNEIVNYINKRLINFLDKNFESFPIFYLFKIDKKVKRYFSFIYLVDICINTDNIKDLEWINSTFFTSIDKYLPRYRYFILKIFNKEFLIRFTKKDISMEFIFLSLLINKGIYLNKNKQYVKIKSTDDKFIYIIPFNNIERITISLSENKNQINLIFILYEKERISVSLNLPSERYILDKFIEFLYKEIYL